MAAAVDQEVRDLLMSCYDVAMDTLVQHRDKLECLAQLLIERETLSREEFMAFIEDRPLPEKTDKETETAVGSSEPEEKAEIVAEETNAVSEETPAEE